MDYILILILRRCSCQRGTSVPHVLEAVYDVCERFGLENLTTKKLGEEAHCSEAMI